MTTAHELQELIAALRSHYTKVKALAEFLDLKQSELRPGDEISFFSFWEAKQNLAMEQSLLAGHALMVKQIIQTERIALTDEDQHVLKDVVAYSRRIAFL